MFSANRDIYNLPNFVSFVRILLAPVLFYFAFIQEPVWFLAILMFSGFTDILDGFIARVFNQITETGSRLDSWGDFTIYSTMAICAWILWPELVLQELTSYIVIVISIISPIIAGLVKYRRITSYHTWMVKVAVVVTFVGYILLFAGWLDWPFRVAAVFSAVAATEEIAITLLSQHEHVDVRSVWTVLKYNKQDQG
ncbi:MAG: CDP-alcohol phosphatidyltransferase family protein [Gammaproteobacteria bacterium]|nr:CDP-alcohol phosphatidyltransferase family protein [Gammaproteobacteria bacterium]